MTTSGTVTFSVNRDQIINDACFDAGVLGVGENLSDDDLQFCVRRLNMMVKQWQGTQDFAPGLKMWSRKRGNLFLSGTTGQYNLGPGGSGWASSFTSTTLSAAAAAGASTITVASASSIATGDNIGIVLTSGTIQWTTVNGAPVGTTVTLTAVLTGAAASGNSVYNYATTLQGRQPLQILTAVLRDSQSNDTPLVVYNLQDYENLPSKTNTQNTADPTAIYYEFQLTNGVLYTDSPAAADVTKYIHTVYLSPIEDFNASTDTPDYPQQWYLPLVTGLAVNIAPAFQLPVTQDLKDNFARSLAIAQHTPVDTSSVFFQKGNDDYARWGNWT